MWNIYEELAQITDEINPYIDLLYNSIDMSGESFFDEISAVEQKMKISLPTEKGLSGCPYERASKCLAGSTYELTFKSLTGSPYARASKGLSVSPYVVFCDDSCVYEILLSLQGQV
jgi:hypothetical protein